MLLAILLISLLVYAWGLFSEYQSAQDELADIEDTAQFNEQFANYDRDGVQGYELLSLINQVIDYNYRKSSAADANSDEKYVPITLKINMNGKAGNLTEDGTLRLFQNTTYIQSNSTNQLSTILNKVSTIRDDYGGDDCATRIAKAIKFNTIGTDTVRQDEAVKRFNAYSTKLKLNSWQELLAQKENIYTYFEYVQFKRGKFNSVDSELKYDATTGRICQMGFSFTGDIY